MTDALTENILHGAATSFAQHNPFEWTNSMEAWRGFWDNVRDNAKSPTDSIALPKLNIEIDNLPCPTSTSAKASEQKSRQNAGDSSASGHTPGQIKLEEEKSKYSYSENSDGSYYLTVDGKDYLVVNDILRVGQPIKIYEVRENGKLVAVKDPNELHRVVTVGLELSGNQKTSDEMNEIELDSLQRNAANDLIEALTSGDIKAAEQIAQRFADDPSKLEDVYKYVARELYLQDANVYLGFNYDGNTATLTVFIGPDRTEIAVGPDAN